MVQERTTMRCKRFLFSISCFMVYMAVVKACQQPLLPVYNNTAKRYLTCNSWEPDCPDDTVCQRATAEWKERLYTNPEFVLYLCCNREGRLITVNLPNNSFTVTTPLPPFPTTAPVESQPDPAVVAVPSQGDKTADIMFENMQNNLQVAPRAIVPSVTAQETRVQTPVQTVYPVQAVQPVQLQPDIRPPVQTIQVDPQTNPVQNPSPIQPFNPMQINQIHPANQMQTSNSNPTHSQTHIQPQSQPQQQSAALPQNQSHIQMPHANAIPNSIPNAIQNLSQITSPMQVQPSNAIIVSNPHPTQTQNQAQLQSLNSLQNLLLPQMQLLPTPLPASNLNSMLSLGQQPIVVSLQPSPQSQQQQQQLALPAPVRTQVQPVYTQPLALPPHYRVFTNSAQVSAIAKPMEEAPPVGNELQPMPTTVASVEIQQYNQIQARYVVPTKPPSAPPQSKLAALPPQPQVLVAGNGNRLVLGPNVCLLVAGDFTQPGKDMVYKYKGTVALIQDGGLNILVDSGSANSKNKLLAALAQQGLRPQNIQVVIYTHAHPDHLGNDNLFPFAQKFFAGSVYKGDEFLPLQQLEDPSMRLTQHVEIWKTPGHTMQHNSILVRNVSSVYVNGTVAISGDLFLNDQGFENPDQWASIATDRDLQGQMRYIILCQADFIIPGHGKPFAVTDKMRSNANCSARRVLAYRYALSRRIKMARRKQNDRLRVRPFHD